MGMPSDKVTDAATPQGDEDYPAVIELNVGGVHFSTSLETLQGDRFGGDGSMLSSMFSGRLPVRRNADGRFFIDRDGRHFHHILNYLRDGTFPVALTPAVRAELEREASFFGLEALASFLRADLKVPASDVTGLDSKGTQGSEKRDRSDSASSERGRLVSASEASDQILNTCVEEWPDFPQYVQRAVDRLLAAGGVCLEENPQALPSGVLLDELAAASLQADTLAVTQIELAHVDSHSKAWRWSDRKTGVNSVLRAKLLRCHLQRLGYMCRIVPIYDKRDISAYVMQVELPIPS